MKDLREQFIASALAGCRYFNGIQNKQSEAGISYEENRRPGLAMPCLPKLANGREFWPCDSFQIVTQAEAEQGAGERIVIMERGIKARHAAKDDAKSKNLGKGNGGRGSLPCPSCDGGTLRYSVASCNGHMHGKCSTAGCVSWME